MTTLPLWVWLLESAASATALAGHWFLQSTLVIAAGLAAARLLRKRGPALESAIYRTTLVAAILCPLVTWLLASAGLTLGIATLPELQVARVEMIARAVPAPPTPVAPAAPVVPTAVSPTATVPFDVNGPEREIAGAGGTASGQVSAVPRRGSLSGFETADLPVARHEENAGIQVDVAEISPPQAVELEPVWVIEPVSACATVLLSLAWIFGASGLVARLAIAHWSLVRLRQSATAAGEEQLRLCRQLAQAMGMRPPEVLRSPFISGPCLAGVRRPTILLPDELPTVPLATVFIHELAHLRRRDCLWNIARQAATAVLFFQPLMWWLSRRLETTAEEVCDDHVVGHGADRLSYADTLVSLAERTWLPTSTAVVPLVTFRSLLGRCVARILDRTRRLSLSISVTALCVVLMVGLMATLGTGALGPAGQQAPPAVDETLSAVEPTEGDSDADVPADGATTESSAEHLIGQVNSPGGGPAVDAVANDGADDRSDIEADAVADDEVNDAASDADLTLHYRGRVLDPVGKPAAGAKIFLTCRRNGADDEPWAVTGVDGQFDFTAQRSDFKPGGTSPWLACDLVAMLDGLGFAAQSTLDFETTGEALKRLPDHTRRLLDDDAGKRSPELRLVRDDVPLVGRVMSIDGKPVSGARVRVASIHFNDQGTLDAWELAARNPKADYYSVGRTVPRHAAGAIFKTIVPDVTTDADGRFVMRGIGRERIVELRVSGSDIETAMVKARTRQGDRVELPHQWNHQRDDIPHEIWFPADFIHIAAPAQPLTGRVTDADSGNPIAGVKVIAGRQGMFFGSVDPTIQVITDDDGRYELRGLPVGKRAELSAVPPDKTSYVPAGAVVTSAVGKPAHRDFALKQGVRVHGRVVESRTGEPLMGQVSYFATQGNPHLDSYKGFSRVDPEHEVRIAKDGSFEIAVLPGPGILTFMASDNDRFRRGVGTETITAPANNDIPGSSKMFRTVPYLLTSVNKNLLHELNLADDARDVEVNLSVAAGVQIKGRLVDPAGNALAGGIFSGEVWTGGWRPVKDDTFRVEGYYSDQPRELFFYNRERDLAGHQQISGPPRENLVVTLQPAGSVRGRLVDDDGAALAGVILRGVGVPSENFGDASRRLATDEQGRFEIRGLVAGHKYTVQGNAQGKYGRILVDFAVASGEAKDVGDVTLQPKRSELSSAVPAGAGGNKNPAAPVATTTSSDAPPGKQQQASGAFVAAGAQPAKPKRDSQKATHTFIPKGAEPAQPKLSEPVGDLLVVKGRVNDPQGQPVAAADVLVVSDYWDTLSKTPPVATAQSGADGRFQIEFRKSQLPEGVATRGWQHAAIVAVAPGSGPAWAEFAEIPAGEDVDLQLVPDEPINGRVTDLEGRPIQGVRVEVLNLRANKAEDLGEWLDRVRAAAAEASARSNRGNGFLTMRSKPKAVEKNAAQEAVPNRTVSTGAAPFSYSAETDADGRFRITGVGHDRVASLKLTGGGIVVSMLQVAVRKMEPTDAGFGILNSRLYGSNVQYAAEPSQPIEGTVRDAKTGQPIPNVRIVSNKFAGNEVSGYHILDTVADAQGHYRMAGMPKGKGNQVVAIPGDDQPYFMCEFDVPPAAGIEPVKFDVPLHRGLWVTGRLTDVATGAPQFGQLDYIPRPDNPHVAGLREFSGDLSPQLKILRHPTDANGNFRLVALPGRGLVVVRGANDHPYPQAQGVREIADLPSPDEFRKVGAIFPPTMVTAAKEIRPAESDEEVTADIALVSGERLSLTVVDPAGKPLAGVTARGLWPEGQYHEESDAGPAVEAVALWPDEKRLVLLHHDERKLGKAVRVCVKDDGPGPVKVTLEPCASVTARLLDGEGHPLENAMIRFDVVDEHDAGLGLYWETTDADGRFTNAMVLPGCKYNVICQSQAVQFATLVENLSVAPGESIDLGEFDATKKERPEPKRMPAAAVAPAAGSRAELPTAKAPAPDKVNGATAGTFAATSDTPAKSSAPDEADADLLAITGQVVDPQGNPVAGADVLATRHVQQHFATPFAPDRTKTDEAGRFRIVLSTSRYAQAGEPRDWRRVATLVASAPGYGAAGVRFAKLEPGDAPTLRLANDEPIEGRIVDLEGRPVVGARIEIRSLVTNGRDDLTEWLAALRRGVPYHSAYEFGRPVVELSTDEEPLAPAVTGADGRFKFTGIGRGRFVHLKLSGGGAVVSELYVVTQPVEPFVMKWYGGADTSQETVFGSRFEFVTEPSQPIEGIVRDAATGKPIPGVQVLSNKFAGRNVMGLYSLETRTDDDGHYRLDGMPKGTGNGIVAVPGDDQPYFMREFDVPTVTGLTTVKLDLELHRGVFIEGRVVEKGTAVPVHGRMYYVPRPDNPHIEGLPEFNSHHLPGPQGRYQVNADGAYRVVGLPGRGFIGLWCDQGRPYPNHQGLSEITDLPEEREFSKISGIFQPRATLYTIVKEVRVGEQETQVTADLEVSPGERVALKIVDAVGAPVSGVKVWGLWPRPQHHVDDDAASTVEVLALQADEKRHVIVHHEGRNLGRAVVVSPQPDGAGPVTVELAPCATVLGRVLEKDGEPVKFCTVGFRIANDRDYQLGFPEATTDDDGRFVLSTVPVGCAFDVQCWRGPRGVGLPVIQNLTVAAGETVDLGEFDVTQEDRPEPKRTPAAAAAVNPSAKAAETTPQANVAAAGPVPDPIERDEVMVRGRVLDIDGRASSRATVYAIRSYWDETIDRPPLATAQADEEGRFEITFRKSQFTVDVRRPLQWRETAIVATAPGTGPGWARFKNIEDHPEVTLQLVPDEPVAGEVVDLEGKPVEGINVHVDFLDANESGDMTAWIEALRSNKTGITAASVDKPVRIILTYLPQLRGTTQTDAEGRFRISGLGRERFARIKVRGPGIVPTTANIVTRSMPSLVAEGELAIFPGMKMTYHGSQARITVEPAQSIFGIVRDAASGAPIANVRIKSDHFPSSSTFNDEKVETVTDAEGRYRLDGLPPGYSAKLIALPEGDAAYLPAEFRPPRGKAFQTSQFDMALVRGVWVAGRVLEKESQRPVRGQVRYYPWFDNPLIEAHPELMGVDYNEISATLAADGSYRIAALPGHGMIALTDLRERPYLHTQGVRGVAGFPKAEAFMKIRRSTSPIDMEDTAIKEIHVGPPAETEVVQCDFLLEQGQSARLHVVDGGGSPLTGITAHGLWSKFSRHEETDTGPDLVVAALWPDEERFVLLHHPANRLGKAMYVHAGAEVDVVVLEPCATIKGRLVNDLGDSLSRVEIDFIAEGQSPQSMNLPSIRADDDGRFSTDAIVPGCKYNIEYSVERRRRSLVRDLIVAAGETIDLGEIDITKDVRPAPRRTQMVSVELQSN